VRQPSVPSSVIVIGVEVSRFGASIRALVGLMCVSGGGGVCAGESCGGGVGSCMGTSMLDSTLLFALKPGS
jgi:hypothetical protein